METALVLASSSPRRRELLSLYGVPFDVDPALGDEHAEGDGRQMVLALARSKCEEVAARRPACYVLAADTLVCLDDAVLGKPKDAEDAARMLRMLSDRTHQVHTGVCLITPNGQALADVETTDVRFLPLGEDTIRRYVATGEPMDKAGAYAIQGRAGVFVSHISGSPSNVVGLPLAVVTRFFEAAGLPVFR